MRGIDKVSIVPEDSSRSSLHPHPRATTLHVGSRWHVLRVAVPSMRAASPRASGNVPASSKIGESHPSAELPDDVCRCAFVPGSGHFVVVVPSSKGTENCEKRNLTSCSSRVGWWPGPTNVQVTQPRESYALQTGRRNSSGVSARESLTPSMR